MCSKYQHCYKFDAYHSWEDLCENQREREGFVRPRKIFASRILIMRTEMTILVIYSW